VATKRNVEIPVLDDFVSRGDARRGPVFIELIRRDLQIEVSGRTVRDIGGVYGSISIAAAESGAYVVIVDTGHEQLGSAKARWDERDNRRKGDYRKINTGVLDRFGNLIAFIKIGENIRPRENLRHEARWLACIANMTLANSIPEVLTLDRIRDGTSLKAISKMLAASDEWWT